MMLYALTVLAMTMVAARLSDRMHGAGPMLSAGSFVAGLGILLVGIVGSSGTWPGGSLGQALAAAGVWLNALPLPAAGTLLIIAGVIAMGASQGMLAAPAITYVGDTPVARSRGRAGVVAIYRLLTAAGGDPIAIAVFALVSMAAGVVFALAGRRRAALSP